VQSLSVKPGKRTHREEGDQVTSFFCRDNFHWAIRYPELLKKKGWTHVARMMGPSVQLVVGVRRGTDPTQADQAVSWKP